MKATYNGFEAKKNSNFAQLPPPGAYIGEIQGVKLEDSYDKTRQVIVLMLEITDGEYAGQYHKVFEEQRNSFGNDVKYRGTLRLTPFIEGDEMWVKNRFEGNIWCIQQSNNGYHWDWDETKLKGKKVGFSVRENSYIGRDGQQKTTTEIAQLEPVDDVRDGRVKLLKPRVQKGTTATASAVNEAVDVTNTVEVPF